MVDDPIQEERRLFESEFNQWLAKQGLLAQLRLGWSRGAVIALLARLVLFISAVALVVLTIGFFLLQNHLNKGGFQKTLRAAIKQQFSGDLILTGCRKSSGDYVIDRLVISENENGFFDYLRARDVRLPMELGQGVWRPWRIGVARIGQLEIQVTTEVKDAEHAKAIVEQLFKTNDNFSFSSAEIRELTLRWVGQTDEGEITARNALLVRNETSWNLEIIEGTFNYGWLREQKIELARFNLNPKRLAVTALDLTYEDGSMQITGNVGKGQSPTFDLAMAFSQFPIDKLTPLNLRNAASGTIAGEGSLTGNIQTGAEFDLDLNLNQFDGGEISIWGDTPVLDAMSFLDPSGSYSRVKFSQGTAQVKIANKRAIISSVDLATPSGTKLQGQFVVRPPNSEEIEQLLTKLDSSTTGAGSRTPLGNTEENEDSGLLTERRGKLEQLSEAEKRIAQMRDLAFGETPGDEEIQEQQVRFNRILELRKLKFIEGQLALGVPPDVINRQPNAQEIFKARNRTYWLDLEISGQFENLATNEAKKILQIARKSPTRPKILDN